MKKFEYTVIRYNTALDFVEFWNAQGQKGWEFCMEVASGKGFTDFLVKRVKE